MDYRVCFEYLLSRSVICPAFLLIQAFELKRPNRTQKSDERFLNKFYFFESHGNVIEKTLVGGLLSRLSRPVLGIVPFGGTEGIRTPYLPDVVGTLSRNLRDCYLSFCACYLIFEISEEMDGGGWSIPRRKFSPVSLRFQLTTTL